MFCVVEDHLSGHNATTFSVQLGSFQYKLPSNQCGDSHYKDKTVSWPFYVYNGNLHTCKDCLYIESGPWFLGMLLYSGWLLNSSPPRAAYMCQWIKSALIQIMASPIRHQAIISTNAGLLSIRPLGTNFSQILIKIQNLLFMKMHLKISSAEWRPFCPGGDESKSGAS